MKSDLLTTGEVARICGVTSDAVLKWIKKGRFPAIRTSGGHFRIARTTLEALGYLRPTDPSRVGLGVAVQSAPVWKHCWEYFRPPPEACKECVVYRARIEKCYEVAELGETIGHSRQFCKESCQDCSFFRACHGLACTVLVVTGDKGLVGRLAAQAESESVRLRFARCGYECSMLVQTFRPSVVVMDSALPEVRDGRLVDSIIQDERVSGTKVIIALRRGDKISPQPGVSVMPGPLGVKKIGRLVETLVCPAGAKQRAGQDAEAAFDPQ